MDIAENYAEQLLLQRCLEPLGYPWPVPRQDVNEELPPTHNRVGHRLFDVDIARNWGYSFAAIATPNVVAWDNFRSTVSRTDSAERNSAIEACLGEIRREYPPTPADDAPRVLSLVQKAAATAAKDADVRAASERWTTCMAPLSITDLPADPMAMPSDSVEKTFLNSAIRPTPDEVRIAVADAECMESSGYSDALYRAQKAAQLDILNEHRSELEQIRSNLSDRRTAVLEIISRHSPAS
ncbi:hypothetical protein E4U02_14590 [Microbacterium paludicola]|uniref:Uncharacterized protein n=1 Tax=Microbacterium paludicola TaxID=300019 RepID=A0A4Y9FN61_9MICO|nr:hypothetical protein [Microbacterium paludicola]MBF0817632.1 hypothetical protein [Microbacterium paludicola]TFU30466.1 hypothetical protein E4U02_14590 [Microbacterium paludicola]